MLTAFTAEVFGSRRQMVPVSAGVGCAMLKLASGLLLMTAMMTWAVDDCDFRSEVHMKTGRVALTCQCNSSQDDCGRCTKKIHWMDIVPERSRPAAFNVRELSAATPTKLNKRYVVKKTYGFTLNEGNGISSRSSKVKFKCITTGLDYELHNKDKNYFLEINLLDHYNALNSSSTTTTTNSIPVSSTTATATFPTESTTPQELPTAKTFETSVVDAPATVTPTPPRAVILSEQPSRKDKSVGGSVLDTEIWLIPVKMLIPIVGCCVLLLVIVCLVIFIVFNRRRRNRQPSKPAFCGHPRNNVTDHLDPEIVLHLLQDRVSLGEDQRRDHTQDPPDNIYDEVQSINSRSSDSPYATACEPTAVIQTSDY